MISKRLFTTLSKTNTMDDLEYNESGRARVRLDLCREIIESIDKLKAEWGVTSRGQSLNA